MKHDNRSFLVFFFATKTKKNQITLHKKTSWLLENYKRKKKSEGEVLYQNEIVKKVNGSLITDPRNGIEATTKL